MYYLKYRPQRIEELDNVRVRETLGKALLENKFAHAYLLIGTRGSGKTTTARLIAKIVNCTNRKKGEEPCNRCESCKAITEARSLDVIEIDAASNTGVEDIRDLREKVKLAPTSSKYKVYIIDEVHMLSTSAFNALLKTLEEPPQHVIFVLCTTDPHKLPATIVSRCLVYDFGKATDDEVVRSLGKKVRSEDLEVEKGVLELIANKADGSFRDADKILEQLAMGGKKISLARVGEVEDVDKVRLAVEKLLVALEKKETKDGLMVIEEFVAKGGKVRELILGLLDYFRNLLLLRNDVKTEVEEVGIVTPDIEYLVNRLIEASGQMRESPVLQLPLEVVVVDYCQKSQSSDGTRRDQSDQRESGGQRLRDSDGPESSGKSGRSDDSDDTDALANRVTSDLSGVTDKWKEILEAVKPYNHSLVALLRGSRPKELSRDYLVLDVFYKFHKDKLSEPKNREILEKVVSGIMGQEIKVKFELSQKK